jgi:hypothetical protein
LFLVSSGYSLKSNDAPTLTQSRVKSVLTSPDNLDTAQDDGGKRAYAYRFGATGRVSPLRCGMGGNGL